MTKGVLQVAFASFLILVPMASALEPGKANLTVDTLVGFGPRVAGSPAMERAANYLLEQYKKAGYVAEIQPFEFPRYDDLGSFLTVDRNRVAGTAMQGSPAAKLEGRLVAVPNFGRASDYAGIDAKGAIVLVKRGETRFAEKARTALAQGAIGVVIVNSVPGPLNGGVLGEDIQIPVLAIPGADGLPLLERAIKEKVSAQLELNVKRTIVAGKNVIAHLEGVTQPKLILGGHVDSVPGSPGANDNASGTAATLEIARNLAGSPLAKQVWFMAFDAEEAGLIGSRAFVERAKPEFLKGLRGMLNFDMVGVNAKLGVGGTQAITKIVQGVQPDIDVFDDFTGSDHASFVPAGVPVAFFFRGLEPNYHQPTDQKVDPKLLDEAIRVGLETVKRVLEAPGTN
jgi:Iap family predicted aminopeptidase